jgi:hypothetical protein
VLSHDGVVSDELRLSPYQTLRIVASAPELLDLESTWSPGGTPPRTHWHPTQQEDFEVLEGALSVVVDGRPARVLGPGETLRIPARTAHRMWNGSAGVTRARWRVAPAQRTEQLFRDLARGLNPFTAVVLVWKYRRELRLGTPKG